MGTKCARHPHPVPNPMSFTSTTSASTEVVTSAPQPKRPRKARRELVMACLRVTRRHLSQPGVCFQADWLQAHLPSPFKNVEQSILQGVASALFAALNRRVTWDRRWVAFCELGLRPRLGRRAFARTVEARRQRDIDGGSDQLAVSWVGRQRWRPPMRKSFAHLEETWLHHRYDNIEDKEKARLRLAGWRLCREVGLPGSLPCFLIQPDNDTSMAVFSRLNGHARGWDHYAMRLRTTPSKIVVTDMGQYSSRCSYRRMERKLYVQSYGVIRDDGRELLWMFDGEVHTFRLPRGYRWMVISMNDYPSKPSHILHLCAHRARRSIILSRVGGPKHITQQRVLETIRTHATATLNVGSTPTP